MMPSRKPLRCTREITMALTNDKLNAILSNFERVTKHPENYVSPQAAHQNALTSCTQTLYNLAARHGEDHVGISNPLTELIIEGFDQEQIWQELELQNRPCLGSLVGRVARAAAGWRRLHLTGDGQEDRKKTENVGDGNNEEEEQDSEEEEEEGFDGNDSEEDGDELNSEDEISDHASDTRTKKSKMVEDPGDSDDESETNFDIDDLRTQHTKKDSKKVPSSTNAEAKGKASVVDDQFFRLADMEKFLEMEDAKEVKRSRRMEKEDASDDDDEEDDDESVDYFEGFDDDAPSRKKGKSSTRDWMYSDFFAEPGSEMAVPSKKKVKFQDEEEEEDEEEGEEEMDEKNQKDFDEESFEDADEDLLADLRKAAGSGSKDALLQEGSDSEGEDVADILGGEKGQKTGDKSSFEKRQEKLKGRIGELEQANLGVKSWQLTGEVGGTKRPENSLLEETLEFDVASRPAPVITEETTKSLEDVIRQRALDQAWDDVQRKTKPREEAAEFKKRVTLDQEKSKLSLGEIYEQEYIKQTQQEAEDGDKEDPLHKEIKDSMDNLFLKLDALSNFHMAPRPAAPEVKIVSNTPAITMEEVTPVSVAEASMLAPEEIKEKEKGELKGQGEKTAADRSRELRQKKQRQRAKAREREKRERAVDKLKPGLGNKYSKKAALARLEKSSLAPSSNMTVVKDVDGTKGGLKSSKAFFSRLQDEVVAEVHGFKDKKKKKKKVLTGTQLKL